MAADTNILTADSKERFPFPREVRFSKGGASGRLGTATKSIARGPYLGAFWGVFFSMFLDGSKNNILFGIVGDCLTVFDYFLSDFEVILGTLWGIF